MNWAIRFIAAVALLGNLQSQLHIQTDLEKENTDHIFDIAGHLCYSTPWEPTPRTDDWWLEMHEDLVNYTQVNRDKVKIAFVGSSSIQYWSTTGKDLWDSKYAPLGAANYGIRGDKTENVLWRIMNGEFDGINPEMVVVYCANNPKVYPSNEDVLRGVKTLLNEISKRLPESKILYVNFNPRGGKKGSRKGYWNRLKYINDQMLLWEDGETRFVFDMFDSLMESWGKIRTDLYQPDELHLNAAGYKEWDRLWNNTFFSVLNS